jgi:hypothetical protein
VKAAIIGVARCDLMHTMRNLHVGMTTIRVGDDVARRDLENTNRGAENIENFRPL